MKRKHKRLISKMKISDNVIEEAIGSWDWETEEFLTGYDISDDDILDLDQENISSKEIEEILFDTNCKNLGKKLALECSKIIKARIKNTANYIKEEAKRRKKIK